MTIVWQHFTMIDNNTPTKVPYILIKVKLWDVVIT